MLQTFYKNLSLEVEDRSATQQQGAVVILYYSASSQNEIQFN